LAPSSNQSKGCAPKGINADMDVVPWSRDACIAMQFSLFLPLFLLHALFPLVMAIGWWLEICQLPNLLSAQCPIRLLGFLEVSLLSLSLACRLSWSALACTMRCAKCANRGVTCVYL
jgi:hypothetical protein